ncbi:GNAT family N-acetyltransferase [Gracilimonas mengyeensis]|uniref:ElaA protein n=1 Tax=Gracilimonas mengyeensis TaxID=1302730 RepID=A0A521FA48_9BACT|nr:GNAT family N-acetyltransferase [Gracilimonas mengyeensis]SMO93045.1 ElaA protein [Gracilimonas mengyeensis]
MEIIYSSFNDLTSQQLEDAFALRQKVFIIEQECFYPDIDGYDAQATHLFFYDDQKLAAYLRIFKKGIKYEQEASIGRIVVDPEYRRTGLGPKLINKGIELCGKEPIRIEAQAALVDYYGTLGFTPKGDVYIVDGIDHIQMTYPD